MALERPALWQTMQVPGVSGDVDELATTHIVAEMKGFGKPRASRPAAETACPIRTQ